MAKDADILVVGAGLNGPALALALGDAGLDVALIEARAPGVGLDDGFDGRAYALSHGSVQVLRALGLWERLAASAQPIRAIQVADGRPGQGAAPWMLHFDGAEIEEGPMGAMLEDRFLRRAYAEAIAAHPRVRHVAPAQVVGQATDGPVAEVTLGDGTRMGGGVLVGCDGRQSGTATRAGIRRSERDYGQTALVCAIAHEKPHDGRAHQLFLPAGPLAILPLPGNRASIVWSERTAQAEAIAAMDDAGFLAALRPRFGDFLGEIALAGDRFAYPLSLSLAQSLTAPRVALVGDAGHGIHPIAGQGLNLGLRDVAALAEVLVTAHRRGEDIGASDVLARYGRWRGWDTAVLAVATDGFNALFSNDNLVLRGVRDLGMGVVGAIPPLRRAFIRQAAGLAGDRPRMMRGEPL
jgi:2-octaprenyl-6-methoxyphenol hydroxylase